MGVGVKVGVGVGVEVGVSVGVGDGDGVTVGVEEGLTREVVALVTGVPLDDDDTSVWQPDRTMTMANANRPAVVRSMMAKW